MTREKPRTFDEMTQLKNAAQKSRYGVTPADLKEGDEFYAVGFTTSDGVMVKLSGIYLGVHPHRPGCFEVHLDGDDEPTTRTRNQLFFFEQPIMVILLRSLSGLKVDADMRSRKAQAAAAVRAS